MPKSVVAKKSSKKGAKKSAKRNGPAVVEKRQRHRKPNTTSFRLYTARVLKSSHPDFRISGQAASVFDGIVHDLLERYVKESLELLKHSNKKTIQDNDFHTVTKMVVPGQLGQHAAAAGKKAVAAFSK